MPIKKNEETTKTHRALKSAFNKNLNPFRDKEAQAELSQYVVNNMKKDEDELSFSIYVKDTSRQHWRRNDHFVKVFYSELRHAEDYYSLSQGAKGFLLSLGEFLMWETNLLVDEEDNPLNVTGIANILGINRNTVRRNMDQLRDRQLVYEFKLWNEKFYIVNPYIMFIGQKINSSIPKLFDELEYVKEKPLRDNRVKEENPDSAS